MRNNENDDDDRARRRQGRSQCHCRQGLYGYLNTFAINSRERVLESRSRRAMRRSFCLSYSRFVLASPPASSRVLFVLIAAACRAFRPIRGSLARLECQGVSVGLRKRDKQLAERTCRPRGIRRGKSRGEKRGAQETKRR